MDVALPIFFLFYLMVMVRSIPTLKLANSDKFEDDYKRKGSPLESLLQTLDIFKHVTNNIGIHNSTSNINLQIEMKTQDVRIRLSSSNQTQITQQSNVKMTGIEPHSTGGEGNSTDTPKAIAGVSPSPPILEKTTPVSTNPMYIIYVKDLPCRGICCKREPYTGRCRIAVNCAARHFRATKSRILTCNSAQEAVNWNLLFGNKTKIDAAQKPLFLRGSRGFGFSGKHVPNLRNLHKLNSTPSVELINKTAFAQTHNITKTIENLNKKTNTDKNELTDIFLDIFKSENSNNLTLEKSNNSTIQTPSTIQQNINKESPSLEFDFNGITTEQTTYETQVAEGTNDDALVISTTVPTDQLNRNDNSSSSEITTEFNQQFSTELSCNNSSNNSSRESNITNSLVIADLPHLETDTLGSADNDEIPEEFESAEVVTEMIKSSDEEYFVFVNKDPEWNEFHEYVDEDSVDIDYNYEDYVHVPEYNYQYEDIDNVTRFDEPKPSQVLPNYIDKSDVVLKKKVVNDEAEWFTEENRKKKP